MNILNINLKHCFGIVKLTQKLDFAGENVVLIYAPNGLMKTSFAKTMQLYRQGKADKVKDVVADIEGIIEIKDEQDNVVLPASLYMFPIVKNLIPKHPRISHRFLQTAY